MIFIMSQNNTVKNIQKNIFMMQVFFKKKIVNILQKYIIVMLWLCDSYYVILLVITSNDILLNLPIALIYHLVFNGLPLYCTSLSFPLSSYCNFNIYSPTFYLLRCDFFQSDPVGNLGLLLKHYNCEPITGSSYR